MGIRLKKYLGQQPPEVPRDVLNRKEAAKLLGISEKTLKRFSDRGLIPFRQIERCTFYSRKKLLLWVSKEEDSS